jgi:elongator complex protein 3
VQTLSDAIYELVRRGHTVADVTAATARLRESGFKVYYHWMPGLPGATPEFDLETSRQLFDDERFRPDGLKLYPTMVVAGTELEQWYREGRYVPYDSETMLNLIAAIKAIVPPYVRISRVLRDIPAKFIEAGLKDSLRGPVRERMERQGAACQCIRCREYGHRVRAGVEPGEPQLTRLDYNAAGGKEIFLSYEDDAATLFGLLRLRVQDGRPAYVRELHVFGPEVPLRGREKESAQHKGLGRSLLAEAERIARGEFGAGEILVLSGTGAREYYRSGPGYHLQGDYMLKDLRPQG